MVNKPASCSRGRPGPQERRATAHELAVAVVRRDMSAADEIAARVLGRQAEALSRPAGQQPFKRGA